LIFIIAQLFRTVSFYLEIKVGLFICFPHCNTDVVT
jgi:hypothetical protein